MGELANKLAATAVNPAEKYILVWDQGTTSSRSVLFNERAQVVALEQQEFAQHYPQQAWVEHDPEEIWQSQLATTERLLEKTGLSATNLAALGITNQRESTLVWDRTSSEPIYPAIVWQDRRTTEFCERLRKEGVEPLLHQKTGKRLDPYFSASKIHWMLENVEGARARAERGELCFGTVDSWLIWKLTQGALHATDMSNAARTLLLDIHDQQWDERLLELFDIPFEMLPELRSCSEIYAPAQIEALAGVPIAGVAGDQHAALFGQACFHEGEMKNTYGTGCFMLRNTGSQPVDNDKGLLTTIAWRIGQETTYALEGSIFVAGALIQWLCDELGLCKSAQECNELALKVEDSAGLSLVPAFAGLGAPHWDPRARGLAIGLTRATNKHHFCRAALEAIAFQSAEMARAMMDQSMPISAELRVDGGAAQSDLLLQMQADLLQVPLARAQTRESTALGAAFFAGLAVGYWESQQQLAELHQVERRFYPQQGSILAAEPAWQRAVERAKNWV